jgi:hypothetical protein
MSFSVLFSDNVILESAFNKGPVTSLVIGTVFTFSSNRLEDEQVSRCDSVRTSPDCPLDSDLGCMSGKVGPWDSAPMVFSTRGTFGEAMKNRDKCSAEAEM